MNQEKKLNIIKTIFFAIFEKNIKIRREKVNYLPKIPIKIEQKRRKKLRKI